MDVVEFVEQVFGLHLMDYQKEFLIKVYEATRDGQSVMYIPGRCYHRSSFKLLEASAIIFDAQAKGLLKPVNSEMIRGVSVMVKVKDILPLIQWNDAQIIKGLRSLDVHIPVIFSVTAMVMLSKVGLFLSSNKGGFIK